LELKLPPADAYAKLKFTLDQINNFVQSVNKINISLLSLINTIFFFRTFGEEDIPLFSPLNGNVIFASGRYSICFSLKSFADIYASKHNKLDAVGFARLLWGDMFFDTTARKFSKKPQLGGSSPTPRTFVHFILEPMYKLFSQVKLK
jgi:U5 small nuclear ribonucleoprotein component